MSPLTTVNPSAGTPLTSSSPAVSVVAATAWLNVIVTVCGGSTMEPGAGFAAATVNGASAPVAPVASRPYSPCVGAAVLGDGVTSMTHWPSSPSGTVKSMTEFRPSEAFPLAMATRLPLGS